MQIVIRHRDAGLCDTLRFFNTLHETTQQEKDAGETVMDTGSNAAGSNAGGSNAGTEGDVPVASGSGDTGVFASEDTFENYMDGLHQEAEEEDGNADYLHTDTARLNAADICIVHVNGVHRLPVLTCACRGVEEVALDLAYAGFLPTSFSRLSTLFSMAVLDDCRLANLECKVSGYQYWQRLRRMTEPLRPDDVPNRYKELLRMSRLWWWMKKLKWAAYGQDTEKTVGMAAAGELTVFCPACPQPGININDDWQEGPDQ
jgi:CxC2 like cysteine cluster associated with KDZ transposases